MNFGGTGVRKSQIPLGGRGLARLVTSEWKKSDFFHTSQQAVGRNGEILYAVMYGINTCPDVILLPRCYTLAQNEIFTISVQAEMPAEIFHAIND